MNSSSAHGASRDCMSREGRFYRGCLLHPHHPLLAVLPRGDGPPVEASPFRLDATAAGRPLSPRRTSPHLRGVALTTPPLHPSAPYDQNAQPRRALLRFQFDYSSHTQ